MPLYEAFGLTIDSPVALPPLREADGVADVSVSIEEGLHGKADGMGLREDGSFDIVHDGIRFLVHGGTRIEITKPPAVGMDLVVGWLTGLVFGAVLVQRDRLTLHANAVALPGQDALAAFVGHSGSGKSTLAALLAQRGLDLFSDDLLGISCEPAPTVARGIPRLKLWRDTLLAFGLDPADYDRVVSRADKYQLSAGSIAPSRSDPSSLPLARIYVLEQTDAKAPPFIEPLSGADAVRAILDNAYRWEAVRLWHGGEEWGFQRCLELARTAQVFRFARSWDIDDLDGPLDLLIDHLAT